MNERHVAISMADLEQAFDDASGMSHFYLDLQTGQVVAISDDTRDELNTIYRALGERSDEDDAFAAAVQQQTDRDWMREVLSEAHQVEQDDGTRYIDLPKADSHEAYRVMEDFIETVADQRLQAQLASAIQGRGAFRRFKDVLLNAPAERERWFAFSTAHAREQILAWLADAGITASLE